MAREVGGAAGAGEPLRTNAEQEDLALPLPQYWDLETLQGMRVTLYQSKISPPCCKIRFLLKYYKVPFQIVEGKKPDSDYKKIPVLDIADANNETQWQINDSFVMVKTLAPILQGRPLTDDELELERTVTFGLMIAAEKDTSGSVRDLCACGGLLGGSMGCFLRSFACCVSCIGPRRIGAERELLTVKEYGDILREHLGAGWFLGGGDKPSVIDVAVFGVLEPFVRTNCGCMDDLLEPETNTLGVWHRRMQAATAEVDIFE